MIIRARVVVTMDGPPIDDGAVAVSDERIIDVGKFSDVSKKHPGDEIVDLGEQVLLPGLINAHCHLDYTCLRGKIPHQKSFTDWIRSINLAKRNLSPDEYVASINAGFIEAKQFGTTTIANLTGFPELISRVNEPIRAFWFAELIDVRDPGNAEELVRNAVEQLKSRARWGLAPHALFTASVDLYRRSEEIAERENGLLTTHLAESGEEMSMFRDSEGPLYDFLKEIGRDISGCGNATPVGRFFERAIENTASPGRTRPYLFVHMNELTDHDFELLKKSPTKDSIVHCPRSHDYFGHSEFQFHKLRDLGFNICLATDSLASNDDLSLFAEMEAFRKEFPDVSAEEILKMVTVNPTSALRQENALGKIRSGFLADLIAIPITSSTSTFDELIGFEKSVNWSMIGGIVQKAP
jgi:cytosine/adenosine deaminase-related metal-dependent hydrolase